MNVLHAVVYIPVCRNKRTDTVSFKAYVTFRSFKFKFKFDVESMNEKEYF